MYVCNIWYNDIGGRGADFAEAPPLERRNRMALSDARKRANKKWNDANMTERYDRIQIIVPKGHKATIQTAADKENESINGYVNKAVLDRMGLKEWPKGDNDA